VHPTAKTTLEADVVDLYALCTEAEITITAVKVVGAKTGADEVMAVMILQPT
jgi:hypothetical protein